MKHLGAGWHRACMTAFMSKLTEKSHWDSVHAGEEERLFYSGTAATKKASRMPGGKAVNTLKRLIGQRLLERMSCYDDYLLWEVIFPQHLAGLSGTKAVE